MQSPNSIVYRPWGYWLVLYEEQNMKVKRLVVDPGSTLSMQRHFLRSEHWFVLEGSCVVWLRDNENEEVREVELNTHSSITIPVNQWHQLINKTEKQCVIIETQFGKGCVEFDIQREGEQ